jgi:hypothetical protein
MAAAAVLLLAATPAHGQGNERGSSAPAQPYSGQNDLRAIAGLHLGGAGALRVEDEAGPASADLRPTPGFHVRLDIPIGDYFAVAPMVMVGGWHAEGLTGNFERSFYLDVDLFPRVRVPFAVGGGHMELYAGALAGYTAFLLDDPLVEDHAHGWNVGALAGAQLFFGDGFGVVTEMGWLRHESEFSGDPVTLNQFLFQAGVGLRFAAFR